MNHSIFSGGSTHEGMVERLMASRGVLGFISRRCRFQRLKDAKFIHGWVQELNTKGVTVLADVSTPFNEGDAFAFEVYGEMETAFFQAHYHGLDKAVAASVFKKTSTGGSKFDVPKAPLVFTLVGAMVFTKSDQPPRKLANSYNAAVRVPIAVDAVIHDVSEWGVGMVSPQRFEANSRIELSITHEGREMSVSGAVRYSRRETSAQNMYRTGVKIDPLDRLELAKWRKFIADL